MAFMRKTAKVLSAQVLCVVIVSCMAERDNPLDPQSPGYRPPGGSITATVLNPISVSAWEADSITLSQPSFSVSGNPAPTVYAYIGLDGTITATGTNVTDALQGPVDVSAGGCVFSGLNSGTDYRIMVVTENSAGYSVEEIVKKTGYALRDNGPAGGWIFHIVDNGDGTKTYYEAAPVDTSSGYSTRQWGGRGANMSGTGYITGTAVGTGKSNTETIVTFFDAIYESNYPYRSYYAYDWAGLTSGTVEFTNGSINYSLDYQNNGTVQAKLCWEYNLIHNELLYDDWFLPSKDELSFIYNELHLYGVGGFVADHYGFTYWSSSEYNATQAWRQYFENGAQQNVNKTYNFERVRAARTFIY